MKYELSEEEKKDYNEKFDILYQMAKGSLRNAGSLDFGAKKIK